jgi:hypothetical protein
MVKEVFAVKLGRITKSDIMEMSSNLSRSAVEKALRELVAAKHIVKYGRGLATFYTAHQ